MKKLLFSCTILLLAFCACSRMDFSQEESLTEAQFASVSKDDGFDWGKLDSLLGTLPDLTAAYVGKLRPIPYNTGFVLINEDWSTPYEIYMKPLNMGNKVKVTYKVDPLDYRDSTPVLSHWDILEGDGKGGYIVRTQSTPLNDSSFTYIITQQDLYGVTFFRPYLNMIPKPKIPVTVVAADPSMGTVSGSGQYCANGRFFEISATPNAGYEFYRWEAVGTKEGWQDKLPTMFSENAPTPRCNYNTRDTPLRSKPILNTKRKRPLQSKRISTEPFPVEAFTI